MVTPVVVLNLFVIPSIALWCYHRTQELPFEPSIQLLLRYMIFTACNVPLTKVGVFLIRLLMGKEILIDSGYYTVLAIAAAVALGVIANMIDSASKRVALQKRIKNWLTARTMSYWQKLLAVLPLVLLIVIAYVIRGPLEIYAGNTQDLEFRLNDFFPWLLIIGAVTLAAVSSLLALLPDKLLCFSSVFLLWFGVASWIQDLFLNRKLSEVNGSAMNWDSLGKMPQYNFFIWLVLLTVVVLLYVRFKNSWRSVTKIVAGVLCLVQTVAICSVFFALPEKQAGIYNAMGRNLSAENQMQLAYEDNLIILLFDTVSTSDFEDMLQEYPEAAEIVKDFVYYDNVCSDYSNTFPSVTHFLTGNEFAFDTSNSEWLRESWQSERCDRFFQALKDAGYERRFCTYFANMYVVGGIDNLEGKADNIAKQEYKINTVGLVRKLLKTSIYRFLPYLWKQPFEVLTPEFSELSTPLEFSSFSADNLKFYQRLTTEGLSVDSNLQKLFSYTHLWGAHHPRQYDVELNFKESASDAEAVRGLFKIVEEYLNQMKALGVYDDATIIIMADHGNHRAEGLAPIFFLKQAGETHECTKVNSAPVRYGDFQATILELIEENDGSFGTSFFDWQAGEERTRTLYAVANHPGWSALANGLGDGNAYYGYTYDTDVGGLQEAYERGTDQIEHANTWP